MGDRARLLLTVLVLALLAGAGFGVNWFISRDAKPSDKGAAAPAKTARAAETTAETAGGEPWFVAHARDMDRRALLPIDSRFPSAMERIHELVGLPAPEIRIAPREREAGWTISVDGEKVADVGEFMTFDEGFGLVAQQARSARSKLFGSDADAELASLLEGVPDWRLMSPTQAYDSLAELDARWTAEGPTMPLAVDAAVASVRAGAYIPNDLWLADPVHVQALALLALVTPESNDAARPLACDLAWTMGYATDAVRMANELPADDLLRHRVLDMESETDECANELDSLRRLERLAQWNEEDEWLEECEKEVGKRPEWTLPAIAAARLHSKGDTGWTMIWVGATLLIDRLENGTPVPAISAIDLAALGGPPINVLPRFEYALGRAQSGGALFGREFVSAWHRAWFYELVAVPPQRNLMESAKAMMPRILGVPQERNGWVLVSWMHFVEDALPEPPRGVSHSVDGAAIGGIVRLQLAWDGASDKVDRTQPAYIDAQKVAVQQFEARPGFVQSYRWIGGDVLEDPAVEERWARASLALGRASPAGAGDLMKAAVFLDDWEAVRRSIVDPAIEPWQRGSWCLWAMQRPGAPNRWGDRTFLELAERFGPAWDTLQFAAEGLIVQGRGEEARRMLEALPEGATPCDECERNSRQNLILRSYVADGRWDDALRVEVPPFEGDVDAFDAKVRVMLHAGELDGALAIAAGALYKEQRNVSCRVRLAHVLWVRKEHQKAAAVLIDPHVKIDFDRWRDDVAPAFAEALGGEPGEAERALAALKANGIASWHLEYMAAGLESAGECELALLVLPLVQPTRKHHEIELAMRRAACMRALDGGEKAQEWLSTEVALHKGTRIVNTALQLREFEFLWGEIPAWNKAETRNFLWVARAISLRSAAQPDLDRSQRVVDALDDLDTDTWESKVIRYFLDEIDENKLLSQARADYEKPMFHYYIALKAHLDGNLAMAIRHYRLSFDFKMEQLATNEWSAVALSGIGDIGKCATWLDEHPENTVFRGWWDAGMSATTSASGFE